MKMKLRTQLLLGFAPIIVLMSMVVVFTYINFEKRLNTRRLVEHVYEAISHANLITKLIVDMETGQRGFLITGKDEFLEPYNDALKQYETIRTNLEKLISDKPAQIKRLDETNTLVIKWHKEAAIPEIAERRKISADAIDADYLQAILLDGVGKNILDNMRTIMDGMIQKFMIDGNVKGELLTQSIAKAMVDQETGQRGFLITGDKKFLQPYEKGKTNLDKAFSKLMVLIDNAHDRAVIVMNLDELESLVEKRQKKVDLVHQVNSEQKTQKDFETALILSAGKTTLDKVRVMTDRMAEMFSESENELALIILVRMAKGMVDQETAQRGFIITGEEKFLDSYRSSQRLFQTNLAALRQLNANAYDIDAMKKDTADLVRLAQEWRTEAGEREIALRQKMNESETSVKEIAALIRIGVGKRILDSIREKMSEFITVEQSLLTVQLKNIDLLAIRGLYYTAFMTLLAVLLSIALMIYTSRIIFRRIGGEPHEIEELAARVAEGQLDVQIEGGTGIRASVGVMLRSLAENRNILERLVAELTKTNEDLKSEMTERKRAEEQRLAIEAQMRHKQKLESIGTLAGGVAHEINNPINGIMNYAKLIRKRLDPDSPLCEFADEIGHESDRVAKIVRNLLSFSRQDKESHSPARIADIVEDTVSLIRTIIRRDQIVLEVEVPGDLPKIKCRSQQIQQVLMNLLTNARDALNERYPEYDPDKIITVTVRPFEKEGRQWLRTTVEDHGAGIPDEIRGRLFDPFFTTKDRTKGTGLGLSISHGIIQDHHGELSVECEAGRYTRFHIDLQVDNDWSPCGAKDQQ